jgi:hypothetical protein
LKTRLASSQLPEFQDSLAALSRLDEIGALDVWRSPRQPISSFVVRRGARIARFNRRYRANSLSRKSPASMRRQIRFCAKPNLADSM